MSLCLPLMHCTHNDHHKTKATREKITGHNFCRNRKEMALYIQKQGETFSSLSLFSSLIVRT